MDPGGCNRVNTPFALIIYKFIRFITLRLVRNTNYIIFVSVGYILIISPPLDKFLDPSLGVSFISTLVNVSYDASKLLKMNNKSLGTTQKKISHFIMVVCSLVIIMIKEFKFKTCKLCFK